MRVQHSKRNYFVIALALCITFLCSSVSVFCAPEYLRISIMHTNDTHGHLLSFDAPNPSNEPKFTSRTEILRNVGGIARRATLIKQIKKQTFNNVLVMDAGDVADGTPFSLEYYGEADLAAMNPAGYDAMTIGNHDLSASLSKFYEKLKIPTFSVLSANMIDRNTNKSPVEAYKIFNVSGAKIAVFGLTTLAPEYLASKEGIDISSPIEAAKKLVPELRKQADIVIALTHIGIDDDIKLAKAVDGIDVIVGGHSHTRLENPIFVSNNKPQEAFSVGGTIIVQDYKYGSLLGWLELRLRRNDGPFSLMSYSGNLVKVTPDIPEDKATAAIVDKYYKPLSEYYGKYVGEASESFFCPESGENTVLNLVCDAMREQTGTEIAIYNQGGVRDNILKGKIRMWDIANVLPFHNTVVLLKIKGDRLKRGIQEQMPGVSGIRYIMQGNKLLECTAAGKPIDDNKIYEVTTISWLANTGFSDITDRETLNIDLREAVCKYISDRKTIFPTADGRMQFK